MIKLTQFDVPSLVYWLIVFIELTLSVSLIPNAITLNSFYCNHSYQYLLKLFSVIIWRRRFCFFVSPLASRNDLQDFLRIVFFCFPALHGCEHVIELFKVYTIWGEQKTWKINIKCLSYFATLTMYRTFYLIMPVFLLIEF